MSGAAEAANLRELGVVLIRHAVDNPWIDHLWAPHAALVTAPETPAGALLSQGADSALFYIGPGVLELYPSETANYRDNLAAEEPRLWIACRGGQGADIPQLVRVTADPTEGEALFECGADIVGTVAMPAEIGGWIESFIETFHVERVFLKRQRDRAGRPGDRARSGDRKP